MARTPHDPFAPLKQETGRLVSGSLDAFVGALKDYVGLPGGSTTRALGSGFRPAVEGAASRLNGGARWKSPHSAVLIILHRQRHWSVFVTDAGEATRLLVPTPITLPRERSAGDLSDALLTRNGEGHFNAEPHFAAWARVEIDDEVNYCCLTILPSVALTAELLGDVAEQLVGEAAQVSAKLGV